MENPVPKIILQADAATLAVARAEIGKVLAEKGFSPENIAEVATFDSDKITLKLNYLEGVALFHDSPLLDKEMQLFPGNVSHTEAYLKERNADSKTSVKVSRYPKLDDEFREIVDRAEANIKDVEVTPPTTTQTFDQLVKDNKIVVVGEIHDHEAPRLSIASKLPQLGNNDGAILVEHLYANRQDMLNDWLKTPDAKMHPVLKNMLDFLDSTFIPPDYADKENYYGLHKLLADAKSENVAVYGFENDSLLANNHQTIAFNDSLAVTYCNSEDYPRGPYDYRILLMNEETVRVAKEAQSEHTGTIIVNAGSGHVRPLDGKDIPAIQDFFPNAQGIVIVDGKVESNAITHSRGLPAAGDPDRTTGNFLTQTRDPNMLKRIVECGRQLQDAGAALSNDPQFTKPHSGVKRKSEGKMPS